MGRNPPGNARNADLAQKVVHDAQIHIDEIEPDDGNRGSANQNGNQEARAAEPCEEGRYHAVERHGRDHGPDPMQQDRADPTARQYGRRSAGCGGGEAYAAQRGNVGACGDDVGNGCPLQQFGLTLPGCCGQPERWARNRILLPSHGAGPAASTADPNSGGRSAGSRSRASGRAVCRTSESKSGSVHAPAGIYCVSGLCSG